MVDFRGEAEEAAWWNAFTGPGEPCSYCLQREPDGVTPDGGNICNDCAEPEDNRG